MKVIYVRGPLLVIVSVISGYKILCWTINTYSFMFGIGITISKFSDAKY